VDALLQVTKISGETGLVVVHIEVQSQRDRHFEQRMYLYFSRLSDKTGRPVCSLAILGDTSPAWRPTALSQDCWGCTLDFKFPIAKLLDYPDTPERPLKVSGTSEFTELNAPPATEGSEPKDPLTLTLYKERVTGDRYAETEVPRPADLISQARLERNYEDTTALHRILLLQHGILRTLEELEELDCKVIDSLSVHQKSKTWLWIYYGSIGALLGLAMGLLGLAVRRGTYNQD